MAHILDLMELKQILRLHMDGLSNRRISDTLGIHRNTINSYVSQFKASKHGIEELLKLSDYELAQLFPGHTTIKNPRFDELMQFFTNMHAEPNHPVIFPEISYDYSCSFII
jgi:biotin operon repressor